MIKLIHGADLHLDSPFSGLTPEQAAARRQEQRELLDRLAGLAREQGADLVLLSGDLLDSSRTYRETAQALARSLGSLPCPVFLAPGNHDFYGPRSLYAALDWPENVHIFTSGRSGGWRSPGWTVWSMAGPSWGPGRTAPPLEGFRAEDGRVQLMAVHGEVDGRGSTAPSLGRTSPAAAWTIWRWGTSTRPAAFSGRGGRLLGLPGCPEGRGL